MDRKQGLSVLIIAMSWVIYSQKNFFLNPYVQNFHPFTVPLCPLKMSYVTQRVTTSCLTIHNRIQRLHEMFLSAFLTHSTYFYLRTKSFQLSDEYFRVRVGLIHLAQPNVQMYSSKKVKKYVSVNKIGEESHAVTGCR